MNGGSAVKVTAIETLACDAGWRNYHFVKLSTDQGIVGWSEFSEDFGSPGISAVIARLSAKVIGQGVSDHVPVYALLGGKLRDRIPLYWSHCATWRINHAAWYKPEITDLDGVKQIGREV